MNSRRHVERDAHRWDVFFRRNLKKWVARYPSPADGRQRLLRAAAPLTYPSGWPFSGLWRTAEALVFSSIYQKSPTLPLSWDPQTQTLMHSIHLQPAWGLRA